MKKHALIVLAICLMAAGPRTGYGVSKETLQMMQQLDTLQQSMQNLQKTVDSQTAVLRTLIEQATDSVNRMKSNMDDLRDSMQKNLATSNARLDSVTLQIQALSESLDEAKARIGKLGEQLTQTQNVMQTLSAPGTAQSGPGAAPSAPGAEAKPQANVPDPDSLYGSGLSYYNGGQYDLAVQAFQDYLHYYGETDRASNAQFYVGDSYYTQGNFKQAIVEYDKCIERYPKGNKVAAAQLKKGFSLIELGQKTAGIRELRSLVDQYPNSHESDLARQKLKKLGISAAKR